MLILKRKLNEGIIIADEIIIRIVETGHGYVRLGIDAPSNVRVLREEIYQMIGRENEEAVLISPQEPTSAADIVRRGAQHILRKKGT